MLMETAVPEVEGMVATSRRHWSARAAGAARFLGQSLSQAAELVRDRGRAHHLALAAHLARFRSKQFLEKLSPRFRFHREAVFGNELEFFDYFDFITTFDILFLSQEYRFLPRSLRPRIVDCGSNIGLSVLWFKHQFPDATIVAFEPDPAAFAVLMRNVARNRWSGVELRNEAVCASAGRKPFFYDPARPGSVLMSLRRECGLPGSEEVAGVRLSQFLQGEVDLLKLDVEGAEVEVVEDLAANGCLPLVRALVLEYHPLYFSGFQAFGSMTALLEQHGFRWEVRSGALDGSTQVTVFAERSGTASELRRTN